MRSQNQTAKTRGEKVINKFKKTAGNFIGRMSLGIGFKEWTASISICALLMPMFLVPVQASVRAAGNAAVDYSQFEPVNPPLSIWEQANNNLNLISDRWLMKVEKPIIYAADNLSDNDNFAENAIGENYAADGGEDSSKVGKDGSPENKTVSEKIKDENEDAANKPEKVIEERQSLNERESKNSETVSASVKTNTVSANASAATVNQQPLPDDQFDSKFSYENNLGAPPGQVEMDSANQAAAIPIRHRAGIANFSFGIPLASLSGRGIDAGAGMTYNSRTWNKSYSNNSPHFTYDVEQSWIAPGFSSGFGHLETRAKTRSISGQNQTQTKFYTEIVPEGVTDPDGTRHRMQCSATYSTSNSTKCTTYTSTDRTFITVPAKPWVLNVNNSYSVNTSDYGATGFTVKYQNGTTITYSGGIGSGSQRKHLPVMMQDRNGNRIHIDYMPGESGRIAEITDTLRRKIKFRYGSDASGNPDKLVAVTIPGMNTGDEIQTVRFYYETMNLNAQGAFTGLVTAPATISVLRYVYMPATKSGYKYDYHSNYGMIKKITRQVGMTDQTGTLTEGTFAASTEYDYPSGSPAQTDVPKYTKRTDDWAGRPSTQQPQETEYDFPAGGISQITVKDNGFDVMTENVSGTNGMLNKTSVFKVTEFGGQSSTQLLSKTEYTWGSNRNLTKLKITNEAGLVKTTEYEYDGYNNQTQIREYDYGESSPTLLRTTEITYETGDGWIANNLLSLPKSVKTTVGGQVVSKTLFEYDHNGNGNPLGYSDIDSLTYDPKYNSAFQPRTCQRCCPDPNDPESCSLQGQEGFTVEEEPGETPDTYCYNFCSGSYEPATRFRGNVTKVTSFSDAALTSDPNADVKALNYDIAGNVVSATLSCCNLKIITYDKANEYAFPVAETKGSSPQLTNSVTYNRNTGLVLSSTDENAQVTSYEYEADTLRQKKTTYPNGGYSLTEYSDKLAPGAAVGFVRQTTTLEADKTVQSYSYYDGRGLGIRSATETPDGWSVSAVESDKLGRPVKSYNPFYASTPNEPVPAGTKYTEVTNYDAFGRTTQVALQDGTSVSTAFSKQGDIPSGFNKTFVTVTDQAGKQRRQVADSLGRIVRVDEPDASGDLGLVNTPKQPTSYEYDANDNLSKVIQSDGTTTQERLFKYDSLSRLTHEKQVEATATLDNNGVHGTASPTKWTKVLKYNIDGLLSEGTDARGVKTSFAYDGLNRVKEVNFTDGTPKITYTYDQARTGYFNKGALTRVETEVGGTNRPDTPATATEFDYDKMGRVRAHRQMVGTQKYNLAYEYNLAGQLVKEIYPSGREVSVGYDASGRLANIADASRTYLNGLQYQGKGNSLNSMTLGNGTTQTFEMNDRLQMTNQTLKRNAEILQKYDYGYGQIDGNGNLDATKNNGQLAKIESYIGAGKQWTQKFSYDAVGRLDKSEEYRGDTNALSYRQKFDYDRFGNMYRKAVSNPTTGQQNPLPYTPIEDADISKQTNRLTTDTQYDDAGNVVQDTQFRSQNFWYDANGRMIKTANTNNINKSNAVYDASGMRVATQVDDVWTFFVYDAMGKKVAEYGGLQATDEGGVKYVLQDHQGSSRAILNSSGYVQARMDYTAFGEEINAGIGQRTTAQGFGANETLNQKYALTERDKATGLDHTWFRKHENRAGRWTSPDPYNGSMSLGNPQSFNRYSYVENQPTNFVDPSGLQVSHRECSEVYIHDYSGDNIRIYTILVCNDVWTFGGGGRNGEPPFLSGGGSGTRTRPDKDSRSSKTDNCDDIENSISAAINELVRRFNEYYTHADNKSGYRIQLGNRQRMLSNQLDKFKQNGCSPKNPETIRKAYELKNRAIPNYRQMPIDSPPIMIPGPVPVPRPAPAGPTVPSPAFGVPFIICFGCNLYPILYGQSNSMEWV